MIWKINIYLKISAALQSLSRNYMSPSMKKEEYVYEGCTLAVNMMTGLLFILWGLSLGKGNIS